jgi:hypothetical protein
MLPALSFTTPMEDYALSALPICDPTAKPGVVAFRSLVMTSLGGGDFGIVRACTVGNPSDHWAGAAWDWKLDATNPSDAALAEALFTWLFATDGDGNANAMLRRAGITFLIWNRQSWSTKTGRVWGPYTGPIPHTDHVHISFGWPGALAQTSLYTALGVAPGTLPVVEEPSASLAVAAAPPSTLSTDLAALVLGALAGYAGFRYWMGR